ncbi:MAG: hypothetical protein R2737_07080 [Candidatus Nanopelagicales bacterium]
MSDEQRGVAFPVGGDGRRSTSATGRAVFADSMRGVDPDLAVRVEATGNWRDGYLQPVWDMSAAAARSPEAAVRISADGLDSLYARFGFEDDDGRRSLLDGVRDTLAAPLGTVEIAGTSARETELSVPYRGRRLFDSDLRLQLDRWVVNGIAEPTFGAAVAAVLDNPEWLDLSDVTVVVLGAGAEMGPLRSLLHWGATVYAVDLPRPELWRRLIESARGSAGRLVVPVPRGALGPEPSDDDIAAVAGADLLTQTPQVRAWLSAIPQPFVLGNYAYADGATHVRLSMAADALAVSLQQERGDVSLAYLATPTDVFAVPPGAVEMARSRWHDRGFRRLMQAPMRMARMYRPNYDRTVTDNTGREVGLADCVVPQQGPNYILAKRLQRWRAIVARDSGTLVSLNVAPATRTRSVVKNRALAAAYAGAGRFGIEVFDPSTSNTLMAALLVRDLRDPVSASHPDRALHNPVDLFADAANHGGLWRTAYEPRSVLGVAAVLGMFESRA